MPFLSMCPWKPMRMKEEDEEQDQKIKIAPTE
jgi:hypothetical protein